MPCAPINWQLVKRAEALLVPHAYTQLFRIRIAFWIANDNCEYLLIVVYCWEVVKFIMLLSNILIIIILFILFDVSPLYLFRRCLYTGNVQVTRSRDLVACWCRRSDTYNSGGINAYLILLCFKFNSSCCFKKLFSLN